MNGETNANGTSLTAHNVPSSSNEFKPTDDQLILFLCNKVNGKPLPNGVTILECDLYGDKNPWEIWEAFGATNSYGARDLYFFTTLKKKFFSGSRLVRTIGLGSWEGEDTGKDVVATGTNQRIGMKKRFRFEKSGTNHDGAWIMHEYSLDSSLLRNPSANNYVLCRFRKNQRGIQQKTGKKRTGQEETRVTRKRRTLVLGLAATTVSADKHVGLGEVINESPKKRRNWQLQLESGVQRTEVVETTTRTESDYEEQEDGDLNMSWPRLFSLELIKINQGHLMPEEDVPMLPNTFYKDLLSEQIVSIR